jgi:hypothetical protein
MRRVVRPMLVPVIATVPIAAQPPAALEPLAGGR